MQIIFSIHCSAVIGLAIPIAMVVVGDQNRWVDQSIQYNNNHSNSFAIMKLCLKIKLSKWSCLLAVRCRNYFLGVCW